VNRPRATGSWIKKAQRKNEKGPDSTVRAFVPRSFLRYWSGAKRRAEFLKVAGAVQR
jgi:hypothetical protein